MAKIARQAHQSKYPTWSARDNYAKRKKKKKAPNKLKDGGRFRIGWFFCEPCFKLTTAIDIYFVINWVMGWGWGFRGNTPA